MMKVLLVSALLLWCCGFAFSELCTKGRRVFGKSLRRKNPIENVTQYIVVRIYPAEINSTFTVKIGNNLTTVDGETTLIVLGKKPKAEVTEVDEVNRVFSLQLNELGKQIFQKRIEKAKSKARRRWKPSLWIPIGIAFSNPKDPNAPRFAEFAVGNFTCTGPKCDLVDPCEAYFEAKGSNQNSEEGIADLPITTSKKFQLKVGFDTPVAFLNLNGKLHYKDNECSQIWRYTDMEEGGRVKPQDLALKYVIRVPHQNDIPPVSYIEYEDKICKTSCGTKPICPTTPPVPACKSLDKVDCSKYFTRSQGARDHEDGEVNLPVTLLKTFTLTVGFETPISTLELTGDVQKGDSQCNRLFSYTNKDQVQLGSGDLDLRYKIRIGAKQELPSPIPSYIEYGNDKCRTTCGTKPVCPIITTTETPGTTTTETPETTTTETPETTTTETLETTTTETPETTTTETPETTTTEIPETTTTEIPETTTTEIPETTTTETPETTTTETPETATTEIPEEPVEPVITAIPPLVPDELFDLEELDPEINDEGDDETTWHDLEDELDDHW